MRALVVCNVKDYGFESTAQYALKLDSEDPLLRFRQRFHTPSETIYLDGNSLGLLSKESEGSIMRVLNEWRTLGIKGWV
ncbi:MAG: hypothetical protein JSW72_02890, partial [Candidatus Bathyarchaeota archaeon]